MAISQLDEGLINDECLSMGIKAIDENYLNGIPEGSVIAVITNPQVMGQLVLYSLATTQRQTQYVSTVQNEEDLRPNIKHFLGADELPEHVHVHDTVHTDINSDQQVIKYIDRMEENGNFILDSMSNIRESVGDKQDVQKLIREIKRTTSEQNGLTYLHFVAPNIESLDRLDYEVLNLLDGVFFVDYNKLGDQIETHIDITKLRQSNIPEERIKLLVGEHLSVDTTRDIG